MSSSTQAVATMEAFFNLATTVAANAVVPSAILVDGSVQALYGSPTQNFAPQFVIWILGVQGVKQEPRYMGNFSRTEDFEIIGQLWGGITDASNVNEQTCASFLAQLYESLDSALNADPSLGGLLTQSWMAGFELSFEPAEQGRAVQMDFQVHCEAIIN